MPKSGLEFPSLNSWKKQRRLQQKLNHLHMYAIWNSLEIAVRNMSYQHFISLVIWTSWWPCRCPQQIQISTTVYFVPGRTDWSFRLQHGQKWPCYFYIAGNPLKNLPLGPAGFGRSRFNFGEFSSGWSMFGFWFWCLGFFLHFNWFVFTSVHLGNTCCWEMFW